MLEDFYTNSKFCPVYLGQNLLFLRDSEKNLEWHLTKLKPIQMNSLCKKKKKNSFTKN